MLEKILALSRWKEHVPFTIPLTLLSYAVGARALGSKPQVLIITVVLAANILSIAFAFMVNEIEDAPDDKAAGKKNPVADKLATVNEAWIISIVTLIFSATFYAFVGIKILLVGVGIIALGILYSWRTLRLKALPVVDVVSHVLLLAGLIVLTGYFASGNLDPMPILPLFFASVFGSSYGQFYNQIRDFNGDKKAGLKNTTMLIGRKNAQALMYFSIIGTTASVLWAFWSNTLPLWLIVASLLIAPAIIIVPNKLSKRDRKTGIQTVNFHLPFLILLTITSLLLLYSL